MGAGPLWRVTPAHANQFLFFSGTLQGDQADRRSSLHSELVYLSPPSPQCPANSPSTPTPTTPSTSKMPSKADRTSAGAMSTHYHCQRSPSQEPTTAEPFSSFPRRRESIRVGQSQQVGTTANCRISSPTPTTPSSSTAPSSTSAKTEDHLTYSSTPDADLTDLLHAYFRLDDNLDAIYYKNRRPRRPHSQTHTKISRRTASCGTPDPWECLVSYICSARAAPTRITHRVEDDCHPTGPPANPRTARPATPSPTPQTLLTAGLDGLQQMTPRLPTSPPRHHPGRQTHLTRATSTYTASPNPTSPTTKSSPT